MAKRGSFLGDAHVKIRVIDEELQIAFDMSHEPWKIAGLNILKKLLEEFEFLEDEETEPLQEIIKLLESKPRGLQ